VKTIAVCISLFLGATTTLLLSTVGELTFAISGLIGLLTTGVAFIAIPSPSKPDSPKTTRAANQSAIPQIVHTAEKDIAQLELILSQLIESPSRSRLLSIIQVAKQLQQAPLQDPRTNIDLHSFFNHYLPATAAICTHYIELTQHPFQTEEVAETLAKTEQALEQIEVAFKKQRSNLLAHDLLDLNVELTVIESSLRLEGLVEKADSRRG